jgi:SAM-dependent methyltransferase
MQFSDTDIIELLRGQFDYQRISSYGSPADNYFWFRKRREVARLLEDYFHSFKKDRGLFVDIGCGDGSDLVLFRDLFTSRVNGWRFLGIEGHPAMLKICQLKKYYYRLDDIDFISSNLTQALPFQDGEADIVYCSEVLEHIVEPASLLAEVKRMLKPGGHFLLTTPNGPNIFQRSYWSSSRRMQLNARAKDEVSRVIAADGETIEIYGHVSVHTNAEWDNKLKAAGFTRIGYRRGALFYHLSFGDQEFFFGLRMLSEAILDLLPIWLTRNLSDQVIGLYQTT